MRKKRLNQVFYQRELTARRRRNEEIRMKLLDILGGRKCVQCGYDQDVRVLQIDHIRAGGSRTARNVHKGNLNMYKFYIDHEELARKDLQVLCANCNTLKRATNGEWNWKGRNRY